MATTESYRIAHEKLDSSSEEGELSSDDDIQNGKTCNEEMETKPMQPTAIISSEQTTKRRPKNIWSDVLTDQSSNDISCSMGTVGMKGFMSRLVW